MSENSISSEVQQFVVRYIQSVEELEILLLLRQDPNKSWSAIEIFQKIQSNEKSIADWLEFFGREGIAERQPDFSYRFNSSQSQLLQVVAGLATAYRERPVAVIEMIYKKPPSDRIQSFADAFRFRKDT